MKKPSQELVDAFFQWYRKDPHSGNEDFYTETITRDRLSGLSREQFIEFFFQFARDGGKVQSGGYRTAPLLKKTLEEQYNDFRAFVLKPFDEGFDEISWLERSDQFKGFGQGIATIYLNRVDKKRFAVLNNKSAKAMQLFGVTLPSAFAKRFQSLRSAQQQLIGWYPEFENFYRTDALTHFLIAVPEGQALAKSLSNTKPVPIPPEGVFTDKTFSLLTELHNKLTAAFYSQHKDEFKTQVEEPLKNLLKSVALKLPQGITDLMETEKGLFSRIPKNDYGKGGAWDFYWGAFYPKRGKRIAAPQLFVILNRDLLSFGFYVGDYGTEARTRFIKNCKVHAELIKRELETVLADKSLVFGEYDRDRDISIPSPNDKTPSVAEWFGDPDAFGIRVAEVLPSSEVLRMSVQELVEKLASAFQQLFPLVLLASYDEPVHEISRFLELGPSDETEVNPQYPLEECASDTHFDLEELRRWVNAIEHKKQAIIYGPPGTGKTFLAEKLALHLIGGGNGFFDIVQFHPAYAYEDFIQGLRPKSSVDGLLEYKMVPGRFKEFCSQASECAGISVLIIDEINRANLPRVLGELMYLLEYRSKTIPLAGGERFRIPENVRIIGTMNTADRSIALVDHALRRRFAFLGLYPKYETLRLFHANTGFNPEGLISVLQRLNATIKDKHYFVGISFFLHRKILSLIQDIWLMEIEPYIQELFFDQANKATSFSWEKVQQEILGS